jgi:hypothetical protein
MRVTPIRRRCAELGEGLAVGHVGLDHVRQLIDHRLHGLLVPVDPEHVVTQARQLARDRLAEAPEPEHGDLSSVTGHGLPQPMRIPSSGQR